MNYTSHLTVFPEESDVNLKAPFIKKATRFVTIKTLLVPIEGNGKMYRCHTTDFAAGRSGVAGGYFELVFSNNVKMI